MMTSSEREQAEHFVFANNAQQSQVFSTFNLFSVAIVGLILAAAGFALGLLQDDLVGEVLAFVQAAFALAGLAFAIWSTETRDSAVQNTYLTWTGLLLEIAGILLALLMQGAHFLNPNMALPFYLIPWIVFALSFFVSHLVCHSRLKTQSSGSSRTVAFGTIIVILIIALFVGRAFGAGTAAVTSSMGSATQGVVLIGAGSLIALILGMLAAIYFFKNLLVKRFDIDLSVLYR
ncbi:MAG: hypothetical protein LBU07_00375 [Coriobacteriales bacterium]|nr:hypothetical protein [Coriobacteriales bacterium]